METGHIMTYNSKLNQYLHNFQLDILFYTFTALAAISCHLFSFSNSIFLQCTRSLSSSASSSILFKSNFLHRRHTTSTIYFCDCKDLQMAANLFHFSVTFTCPVGSLLRALVNTSQCHHVCKIHKHQYTHITTQISTQHIL